MGTLGIILCRPEVPMRRAATQIVMSFLAVFGLAVVAFGFTSQQASDGKTLYAQHCAVCHGADAGAGPCPGSSESLRE